MKCKSKSAEWRKAEKLFSHLHASSVFALAGSGPLPYSTLEETDRDLEELLDECPSFFPALFHRAEYYLRIGRNDEGEDLFDQGYNYLIDQMNDQAEFRVFFLQKMDNLEKLLRYDLAIEYLEKAIQEYPKVAIFYDYLAYYLLLMPKIDLQKAMKIQEKALSMEPDNDCFLNTMGWIQLLQGNYNDARKNFKKALEKNKHNTSSINYLDATDYMQRNNISYFNYLIRPVDMDKMEQIAQEGEVDDICHFSRLYNTNRLDAFTMHHLHTESLLPHEILNIVHPFKDFMNAVEDTVGDEVFLYENADMLIKEARYFFFQFVVRYDNIHEHFIEDVLKSLRSVYNFFQEVQLVTPEKYQLLVERYIPVTKEFTDKIEGYNKIRYNPNLEKEEKERMVESLFGL